MMPQNRQESVLMISQLGWLSPGVSCGGFSHEMKPRLSFSAGNPNSDGGDQWLCSWWSRAATLWRSGGPCLYPGQDGTDQTSIGCVTPLLGKASASISATMAVSVG